MEYPLWLTELPSTDILSNKWRQGTVLKGNKQCKEDYIKAVGDRCQLSSVQGVSATGLSKRISPPFVAVGGTVGKFASRINAGVCKTEFINHISISTYHKLVHVNPHDVRWKAHTGVHASSGFVIQCNVSWWCWVDFKWRIKDFIWSFLQLSDSGIYTCVAASSSGETSWSAFLEVKGTSYENQQVTEQ